MTKENRCTKEIIRQFLRGEMDLDTFTGYIPMNYLIRYPDAVSVTFEDVLAALKNMRSKGWTMADVQSEWYGMILDMADYIGLARAAGLEKITMDEQDLQTAFSRLPFSREEVFLLVLAIIQTSVLSLDPNQEYRDDLQECIEMMENTLYNEERSVHDWKLSTVQQMRFITDCFEKERIDLLDTQQKELFKRCTDECADAGVYDAMRIKAFCCYGGNTVYPCDWGLAADYFRILVDEVEDPMAANALGYIYYYGRLNDGEPDYESAYRYFSLGAFCGVYESMYKVADLLEKGNGIPKNGMAAMNQVRNVYIQTKTAFINGIYSIAFADAALRYGNYYRSGTGVGRDPYLALSYYLDARTAIMYRMRYDQSYGDESVYRKIMDAVSAMEKELGTDVRHPESREKEPILINRMLSGGYPLKLSVRRISKTDMKLVFSRGDDGENMLLTVESMLYSRLAESFEMTAENVRYASMYEGEVIFDQVAYDVYTGETVFAEGTAEVMRLQADAFVFKDDRDPAEITGDPLPCAVVFLSGLNENREYICEIPGLKRGDHVILSDEEHHEGTVVRLFYAYETETAGWQRVLQKIGARFLS